MRFIFPSLGDTFAGDLQLVKFGLELNKEELKEQYDLSRSGLAMCRVRRRFG